MAQSPKYKTYPKTDPTVLNCTIAYNEYGGYCIPTSSQHRPAVQKILKGEIYEPETIAYMTAHCKAGDIIHAGTFFGDFLPALSKALSSQQKIWAFEPNPENYRCAVLTKLINSLNNIELFNSGLGESASIQKLMIQNDEGIHLGGASMIVDEKEKRKGTIIDTNIIAIDEIIPQDRNISIIQLDVERYEQQALAGAMQTIKRCKPILILEDNNNMIGSPWFNEHLASLNYKITGKVHDNTILEP